MDQAELIALIKKFHQGSITDLELARLKMFVGKPTAQDMLESIDFPVSGQDAPADVPPDIYEGLHRRIFVQAKPKLRKITQHWIAAAASILLLASVGAWLWSKQPSKPVLWANVSAFPGERKKIILPDSSVVYLNAGSSISYPERYADSVRLVYLKGEAFFEIAQQADQPFIVQTAHTSTKVLGTRFNIEAHEREGITRVALVDGKVQTGDSLNRIILLPGRMMVHDNNTGHQSVSTVDGNVAGWTSGELVFNGISLNEAVLRISEAYNIKVHISPQISGSYTITGHFQRERPEKILDALLAVHGFKWKRSAEGYQIYK